MKKFFKSLYDKIITGGVIGISAILFTGMVLAFTESTSGPSITEPTNADSTGQIETLLGTPQSVVIGTDTIFGYLRTIYTNIGKTPSSVSPNSSDAGKLTDLVGTSATVADGKTLFNFLKNINDSLDFPEVVNVRSIDTVKNASGSIGDCSTPGAQGCYATGNYYASTLCASQGSQSCFAAGTYYASTACASQGSQSCYTAGTYYAATQKTVSDSTVSQLAGYYPAFNLSTIDTNLVAGNIKTGVNIFGVVGTFVNNNTICTVNGDCTSGYCYRDADNDNYAASSGTKVCKASASLGTDCDENDTTKWRYRYADTDGDGYGTGSLVCVGNQTGYADNNTDCNINDGTKWQNLTCYTDNDGDGYGVGSGSSICIGASCPSGFASNNTDCYDSNANVYPEYYVPKCFTTHRGDGSFDYNCDGYASKSNDLDCITDLPAPGQCLTSQNNKHGGWISHNPSCGESGTFRMFRSWQLNWYDGTPDSTCSLSSYLRPLYCFPYVSWDYYITTYDTVTTQCCY